MGFGRELSDFATGFSKGVEAGGRLQEIRRKRPARDSDIAAIPDDFSGGGGSVPRTSGGDKTSSTQVPGVQDGKVDNDTAEIAGRLKGDLMRDFKISDVAANGIVASLAAESGGFKQLQELAPTIPGTQGGWGYAQWTGPRRVAFADYAQKNKLDPKSYEANYGFLKTELQGPEGKILEQLKNAQNTDQAIDIFTGSAAEKRGFLRPGKVNMPGRLSWGRRLEGVKPIGGEGTATAAAGEGAAPSDTQLSDVRKKVLANQGQSEEAAAEQPERKSADTAIPVEEAPVQVAEQDPWNDAWQVAQVDDQQVRAGGQSPPRDEEAMPTLFAAEGGAIPDPTQRFQGGGAPIGTPAPTSDKYSQTRAYTQPLPAWTSTSGGFTPRRVGAPAAQAALTNAQGRTPSQQAFYDMRNRPALAPAAAAPAAAPANALAGAARPQPPSLPSPYSNAGYYAGNATAGRGVVPRQSAAYQNYEKSLAAWKAANPGKFARGGKVKGGNDPDLFKRLLAEETRNPSGPYSQDSARDRAARRYNIQTRGVNSLAYKDDDGYFQKPKGKARPAKGGVKLPGKAPRPTPRPDVTSSTKGDITPQAATGVTQPSPITPQAATGNTIPSTPPPQAATGVTQPSPITPQAAGTPTGGYEPRKPPYLGVSGRTTAPALPAPVVPTTDPQAVLGDPTAAQSVSRNFRPGQIVPRGEAGGYYDAQGNPLRLDNQGKPIPPSGQRPIYGPDGGIIGWENPAPEQPRDDSDLQPPVIPGLQEGGAIPDGGWSPFQSFEKGGAVQGGYDYEQGAEDQPAAEDQVDTRRPERQRYDNVAATPRLLQDVGDAISGGVNFLTSTFGLGQDGGIDTPEAAQARESGTRRFAGGEGAATRQEIDAIDDRVDPNRSLDEGHRQMVRLAKTMKWYREQGREDDAKAAAGSLLQYGAQRFGQLGSMAGAAYRQYEQSGDKQDLNNAVRFLEQAYDMVPDGANFQVELNEDTGKLEAYRTDAEGHEEKFEISAHELPQYIRKTMDNSMYWNSILSTADPGMARQKESQRFQEEQKKEGRGYERGEEERKHQRDLEESLAEEKRKSEEELAKEKRTAEESDRQKKRDEEYALQNKLRDEALLRSRPAKDNAPKPKIDMTTAAPALTAATQARQALEANADDPAAQDAYNESVSRLLDAVGGDAQLLGNFGFDVQGSNFVYKTAKEAISPADIPADIKQAPDGKYYKKGPDGRYNIPVNPKVS